jgi:hypothetical protein
MVNVPAPPPALNAEARHSPVALSPVSRPVISTERRDVPGLRTT